MKKQLLFCLLMIACGKDNNQYTTVQQGAFRTTLTETGELQAVQYTINVMPPFNWSYGRPKIADLTAEGTRVQKGDAVAQIETSGVIAARGKLESDLLIAQSDLNKMRVQHDGKIKDIESRIQNAKSALRRATVDLTRVRFESDTQKKIKTLDLQTKTLALEKLQMQLASTHIQQKEDLHIKLAKIQKIESNIVKAGQTIDKFTLRAASPGIVEYRQNRRTKLKVAIGDQLWPGSPIIGLPDLSQMKALTTVNETDIDKIKIGQPVAIKLDAFPKFVFKGEITQISRISRRKNRNDKSKVFDVEILLSESNDLQRPGMTVSCEFLIADFDNALFVNNSCIKKENNQHVVYVKDLWGVKPVPVTLGPRNAINIVIFGDIEPGAQVAIGDPT